MLKTNLVAVGEDVLQILDPKNNSKVSGLADDINKLQEIDKNLAEDYKITITTTIRFNNQWKI